MARVDGCTASALYAGGSPCRRCDRRPHRGAVLSGDGPGRAGSTTVGRRVGSGIGEGVWIAEVGGAGWVGGAAAGWRPVPTVNCQWYPPRCPFSSRAWIRTSCVPPMKVRTKLTILTLADGPAGSTVIASPSTKAVTSTRSVEPLTRALMTMSPGGSITPGAGWRLLTIGERPGDPNGAGLPAIPGEGDGGGPRITVGVTVRDRLLTAESVGGTAFSRRTGVPPVIGGAPSRGRCTGGGSHAVSSSRASRMVPRRQGRDSNRRSIGVTYALGVARPNGRAVSDGRSATAAR